MLHRLETLLDEVALALTTGDLATLARLTPELESIPAVTTRDQALAERLRRKAERNARLLQAALRGLRAARFRIAEISAGPRLSTYDRQGQRSALATVDLSLLRRS